MGPKLKVEFDLIKAEDDGGQVPFEGKTMLRMEAPEIVDLTGDEAPDVPPRNSSSASRES